ncbi:MAG: aldo/keto reductase [Anaerolineae bacterium]|nr:aldo/keto reductase [Anaerolineae bacterium]
MHMRQLGQDQISAIGFGAWPIGGGMGKVDKASAIATIHAAIDNGITLMDTAQYYRDSEAILGEALQNGYRERCFLATKVSTDYSPEGTFRAMENSLRALRVEYVDLYQVHSWDARYPIEATMEAMEKLQQQGKTRYIGVSNFNAAQMKQAGQTASFQANQIVYNLLDRGIEREDIPYCKQNGIGILAHSVLAKGLLAGKYTVDTVFPPDDERSGFHRFNGDTFKRIIRTVDQLKPVAADLRLTLVQLSLAWVLRLPEITCALVGAKTPQQVMDYLPAADVKLSPDVLAQIDSILDDLLKSPLRF